VGPNINLSLLGLCNWKIHEMAADRKEDMGAVTQQISAFDDDMHKNPAIKEANVASVALGTFSLFTNHGKEQC
jgi:hypothetical protein